MEGAGGRCHGRCRGAMAGTSTRAGDGRIGPRLPRRPPGGTRLQQPPGAAQAGGGTGTGSGSETPERPAAADPGQRHLGGSPPGAKGRRSPGGGEESESGELSADWLEGWRQRDGAAGHVTPGGSRPWGPSGREAGPGPGRAPPPRSPLPASSAGGRAPPRSSGPRGRFPLSSAVLRPTGRRRRSLGGSRPCPGLPVPFPGP